MYGIRYVHIPFTSHDPLSDPYHLIVSLDVYCVVDWKTNLGPEGAGNHLSRILLTISVRLVSVQYIRFGMW